MIDEDTRRCLEELVDFHAGARLHLPDFIVAEATHIVGSDDYGDIATLLADTSFDWSRLLVDHDTPDAPAIGELFRTHEGFSLVDADEAVRNGDLEWMGDYVPAIVAQIDRMLAVSSTPATAHQKFGALRGQLLAEFGKGESASDETRPTEMEQAPTKSQAPFAQIPREVGFSAQFAALTPTAVRVLLDAALQLNGRNNGDLSFPYSRMKAVPGFRSDNTLRIALGNLVQSGFLIQTREASRARGQCALFALTWHPIQNFAGKLAIATEREARQTWRTRPPAPARAKKPRGKTCATALRKAA